MSYTKVCQMKLLVCVLALPEFDTSAKLQRYINIKFPKLENVVL